MDKSKIPVDDKVLWVSPDDIWEEHKPWRPEVIWDIRRQRVVDGDWDKPRADILKRLHRFYEGWQEHLAGKPLRDTDYGRVYCRVPERSDRFEDMVAHWCTMWEDIRDNGYRPRPLPNNPVDEYITIDIGRDGQLFFHNGLHRLVFCRLAGIQKIPVKVMIRHTKWQEIRDLIEARRNRAGRIYQRVDHIDLAEYPAGWDDWRLNVITCRIGNAETVLDLGAHWGQTALGLAKIGKQVTAVEKNANSAWFINRLQPVYGVEVEVCRQDVLDYLSVPRKFDTVIMLNLIHHLLKTKELFEGLTAALKNIKTDKIFFMPHDQKLSARKQLKDAYWNPADEEFIAFVSKHTGLKKVERLGEQHGRRLYLLERQ